MTTGLANSGALSVLARRHGLSAMLSASALCVTAGDVLAAGAEQGKAGLPQLDPSTFASQLFWLAVIFVVLYLLMSKVALPRISDVLGERQRRIDDDLDKAEKLKVEAEKVLETYEAALADARAQAHQVLADAQADVARVTAERESEFAARMAAQTGEAEQRISQVRSEAIATVRSVASDTAAAIVSRVSGLTVAPDAMAKTVDTVLENRQRAD